MRLFGIILVIAISLTAFMHQSSKPLYVTDIKVLETGDILMTSKGEKTLRLYDQSGGKVKQEWKFEEIPTGLEVFQNKVFVTCFETKGELAIIDLKSGEIETKIRVGHGATAPLINKKGTILYVCNQFDNTISEVDLAKKQVTRVVDVLREPKKLVLTDNGNTLFVVNFLPAMRADLDYVASALSIIDTKKFKKTKDILLENGSNALRGIAITPDNKYVLVSHNLGRYTVPTSQLQQGWMNTSAISVVDIKQEKFLGAFLVDEPEKGAAGVWGIDCTNDKLVITHSGVHEISVIDYPKFVEKFEAYANKEALNYDLTFLYGIRERISIEGNGPRNVVVKDNNAYMVSYFSDDLNIYDLATQKLTALSLNPNRQESESDKGDRIFNDAKYCSQNWQSCNGCHPGDARTDGMNWDLMNDGIGNSKNCKSLLLSHETPACMISGIRENAELAVKRGFYHIQFYNITDEDAASVDEYLKGLKPVASPFLVEGKLSAKAVKGKEVFEQVGCNHCHSGEYFTDMKLHRIGDDIEFENGWDTPTLIEVWRTAPYLFDGRAATLHDVFEVHRHGLRKTDKLSKTDLECLVEYVGSL